MTLRFHTSFNEEFVGDTPSEIVEQLYLNSKRGMGDITFEGWWAYQQKTWAARYGACLPGHTDTNAHQKLLDFLVRIGALEVGPLPR